jgi:hypothetical protein
MYILESTIAIGYLGFIVIQKHGLPMDARMGAVGETSGATCPHFRGASKRSSMRHFLSLALKRPDDQEAKAVDLLSPDEDADRYGSPGKLGADCHMNTDVGLKMTGSRC